MRKILFLLICSFYTNVFANELISLNSEQGGKMLVSSISAGYGKQFLSEVRYFVRQQNTSFGTVATAVIILNTLGITPPKDTNFDQYRLFTQDNIFMADKVSNTDITPNAIFRRGLTLDRETKLLNLFNGVRAKAYHTDNLTEAQTRNIIVNALKTSDQLIIANVLRNKMGESGNGHISPIAAYDPKSDSVLYMDVASFKYGPTWVTMHNLYNAMHTRDDKNPQGSPETCRGFIIVTKDK